MASSAAEIGPYSPPTNILQIIQRQRQAGLPEVINAQLLKRLGMPEGNFPRILQSLKFLGFIDEDGHQTDLFQRLRKAPTEDYPNMLAQVLKSAYEPIFAIRDPATATDIELADAFRHYEPSGQRTRMVTLFLGLCREAELVTEGPVVRTRRKFPVKRVPAGSADSKKKVPLPPSKEDAEQKGLDENKHIGSQVVSKYHLLQVLLNQLPVDAKWTQKRRDQWLGAVAANIDFLIEIEETSEKKEPQQILPL